MNEVRINISHHESKFNWEDYINMKEWCLQHLDSNVYYVHPPKEALDRPARFQFINTEDEFVFKMTFGVHDIDDSFNSTTVKI